MNESVVPEIDQIMQKLEELHMIVEQNRQMIRVILKKSRPDKLEVLEEELGKAKYGLTTTEIMSKIGVSRNYSIDLMHKLVASNASVLFVKGNKAEHKPNRIIMSKDKQGDAIIKKIYYHILVNKQCSIKDIIGFGADYDFAILCRDLYLQKDPSCRLIEGLITKYQETNKSESENLLANL